MTYRPSDITAAFAELEAGVKHCMTEDVCTQEILAALDYLRSRASVKWPFDQFRVALFETTNDEIAKEARRQVRMASLNGIRKALQSLKSF